MKEKINIIVQTMDGKEHIQEIVSEPLNERSLDFLVRMFLNQIEKCGFIGSKTPEFLIQKEGFKTINKKMIVNRDLTNNDKLAFSKNLSFGVVYNNELVEKFNYYDDAENFFDSCILRVRKFLEVKEYPLEFQNPKELKLVRLFTGYDDILDNFNFENTIRVVEFCFGTTMSNKIVTRKEKEEIYFGFETFA